ncbi:MAG: isoamylase early set domain-containing protein [Acidimicrobiales bacterium]
MITKKAEGSKGTVRVTFSLPKDQPGEPVWVVGDFNGWAEQADLLRARSNGRRSVAVSVPAGRRITFRYRTASGQWFDDDGADGYEANPHGSHNAVVFT